jgi:hypothetical protein
MMIEKMSRRMFAAGAAAAFGLAGRRAVAGDPKSEIEFTKVGEPDLYAFTKSGTESRFGKYTAFGEMFVFSGQGVAVLTAANGDQIVGVVEAATEEDDRTKLHLHFSWRDSVVVGGRTYVNTGRFAKHLPPGLIVIDIVAIALGLLFPSTRR